MGEENVSVGGCRRGRRVDMATYTLPFTPLYIDTPNTHAYIKQHHKLTLFSYMQSIKY